MHFQQDFNKVSQKQFRGVCDQDCTVILLKVPSKWFLAMARVSLKGHSTYGPDPGTHYAARIQSPPDFGQFFEHAFYFYFFLRFMEQQRKQFLAYM